MTVYALVSSRSSTAVELYLSRAEAEAAVRDIARDEPTLAHLLSIVPLDLGAAAPTSSN